MVVSIPRTVATIWSDLQIAADFAYWTRMLNGLGVTARGERLRPVAGGNGAGCQTRTDDLMLTRQLLYQLS